VTGHTNNDGPALTRILRTISVAFAAAGIAFGTLLLPRILTQFTALPAWWSVTALFAVFGLPVVTGVVSRWGSARVIRRLTGGVAVGQLLVLAAWVPLMTVPSLPVAENSPWVLGAAGIGTTAAAIAWRAAYVWPYIAGTTVLIVVDRFLASPQPVAVPFEDALYTLMSSAVFAALAFVSVQTGQRLDDAADAAHAQTSRDAAVQARSQERARVNALMHDGVLSTLLVAAREEPALRRAAAVQARKTLAQIDAFAAGGPTASVMSGLDFVWLQQATTTDLDPDAAFTYDVTAQDSTVPADVAQAISEGLAEALRNIHRHASVDERPLNRAVHVKVDREQAEVTILDDGRGFNPSSVSPERLGITVSIKERMQHLAGGHSQIVSELDRGTRVVLGWSKS
jgi:hypothetical protein